MWYRSIHIDQTHREDRQVMVLAYTKHVSPVMHRLGISQERRMFWQMPCAMIYLSVAHCSKVILCFTLYNAWQVTTYDWAWKTLDTWRMFIWVRYIKDDEFVDGFYVKTKAIISGPHSIVLVKWYMQVFDMPKSMCIWVCHIVSD